MRAAHEGLAAGIETDSRHRVAGRIVGRRGHGKAASSTCATAAGRSSCTRARICSARRPSSSSSTSTSATSSGSRAPRWRPAAAASSRWRSTTGGCWRRACARRRSKFHGLEDVETRYRRRELDLLANEESRRLFAHPGPDDRRDPPLARRARLRRGRDAGPSAALRRRPGASLRHPPQRARPRLLSADRHRAVPQAAGRRRYRPRLRARQGLPQRGRLPQAQP